MLRNHMIIGLAAVSFCAAAPAEDLLVSSRFNDSILRYDAQDGTFHGVFASGPDVDNPNGMALGPNGDLFVGLGDIGAVARLDVASGAYLGQFIPQGSGGLGGVRDIVFGPDGDLYVASGTTDEVLKYSGVDGAYLGIAASGHGLDGPVGLTFGPNGHLFVGAALTNAVLEFGDGNFVRSFDCGPTHSNSVGVQFGIDGKLYVTQSVTNEILRFDIDSGECDVFAAGGRLNIPIYMNRRANGNLLVGSFGNDRVLEYAPDGTALGALVTAGSGGLDGTHDLVFIPEPSTATLVLLLAALRRRP